MNFSPRRKAAAIILAAFLVLGSAAIYAGPLSAHTLERRLAFAAEEAIYAVRADSWARITMDGQTVTLSGQAPSRAARDEALRALSRASWAGGAVAGGITRVVVETRLAHEGEAVRLAADLVSNRLTLTGFAPDAEAVERITARAERLFPGRADVTLRIAPGVAQANWDLAVRLMLTELARLDYGGGRVADGRIALTGLASNTQTLTAVRRAFELGPEGYLAGVLVRTDGETFTARIADARLCELLIDSAIGSGSAAFTPGRAMLTPGSASVLRRAGRVFAACDVEPLAVAVRAEDETPDGEALALERAEAIISAMAEAGAARERFLAESAPSDADTAFQLRLPVLEPAADDTPVDSADEDTTGDVSDDTGPASEAAAPDVSQDAAQPREG